MSKTDCGVYYIKNINTNKYYVGSSIHMKQRWSDHLRLLRGQRHHSIKLQNSWNLYGEDSFEFGILLTCSATTMKKHEERFISILNAYSDGYNMVPTADGGRLKHHTEDTKQKISKANCGKKNTPEQSQRQSNAQLGRKHSEETKAKIAAGNRKKKKPLSEEHKEKLRQSQLGRKFTEEERAATKEGCKKRPPMSDATKAKLSAYRTGRKTGPHSEETKAKISASNIGKHSKH